MLYLSLLPVALHLAVVSAGEPPTYHGAASAGESISVPMGGERMVFHKRPTGWGWAEVLGAGGTCLAVVEHLGEVRLPGLPVPLRMEAPGYTRTEEEDCTVLVFETALTPLSDMVGRGHFFSNWFRDADLPPETPLMRGEAVFRISKTAPEAAMDFRMTAKALLPVSAVRGPWVRVGSDSFGGAKTDAIFPGLEWTVGKEWSSGTNHLAEPWALRVAPHPYKVTIPLMAVSHGGRAISLAWDPLDRVRQTDRFAQPVFASPNFIDRRDEHLMGIMYPGVKSGASHPRTMPERWGNPENSLTAEPPFQLWNGNEIRFRATLRLSEGGSLEAVTDWVRRNGLPEPGEPRWPLREALDRIAAAYDTHLWHEGKGWGKDPESAGPHEPLFLQDYLDRFPEAQRAKSLRAKMVWVREQPHHRQRSYDIFGIRETLRRLGPEEQQARAERLLALQRADGSVGFDPHGVHRRGLLPDNFAVAEGTWKPLGRVGETALYPCATAAIELLVLAELTGDDTFAEAARRALDYCLPMVRPNGGDAQETPLLAPNLLATGYAAIAYSLGYERSSDPRYLDRSRYWLRGLLPFTQLWEAPDLPALYNTNPCFSASGWWLANWTAAHVQWEVLTVFAAAERLGVDWSQVDSELDWDRYHRGVTIAALRWMVDHDDPKLDNKAGVWPPMAELKSGILDTLFFDIHDSTRGIYMGAVMPPDRIASNILAIMEEDD